MNYIDFHIHKSFPDHGTTFIRNLFPEDSIPEGENELYFSVGLHPWHVADDAELLLKVVKSRITAKGVVAVGECGLDKLNGAPLGYQQEVFLAQAAWAEEYNMPLVVHCVHSFNEIYHLRKGINASVPWIIHGYTGNVQITNQLLKAGFYFSFGHMILNDNARVVKSLQMVPSDRFFLETDDAEISIQNIYRRAAIVRNVSEEALKQQMNSNFAQIFNL